MSTMKRLEGRVILITGAARGLGRACALRCAEEGAALVLTDIGRSVETVPYAGGTADQLEATARDARGIGVHVVTAVADVREGEQLSAAAERGANALGAID